MFVSPAVAGDLVFVGSCSGSFFALTDEGEVRWSYATSEDGTSAQFHGDVIVSADLVIVGSDAEPVALLYAFERATGKLRWSLPFPGGVASDLRRLGEAVLAVAVSGEVVSVDLESGEVRWRVDDPPDGARGARNGDPALAAGHLIAPWRPGVVDAFDAATGERLWRRQLGASLNTSAVAVGGEMWVGAVDGWLHRLRADDGEPLGSVAIGGMPYGDLVPAGECLLVLWSETDLEAPEGSSGGHVAACVEPASGTTRWRHESAGEWGTFHPLVRDGEVILGARDLLLGLALTDGSLRWERPIRGLPRGLGTSQETLFVGTLAGPVFALPWRAAGHGK